MRISGGEALVKSLVGEGVEVVFGIPGIQLYGIVAALRDEPGIEMITTRHEQAATYMAYGYARASGKPGVALVVPGVGIYNAAAGLATAYARSCPVLLIAGQIPRGQMGKNLGGVHEIEDQIDIVRPVTKWQQQALTPKEIPGAVSEAFLQMRSGRPRPVYLEIPPDAGVERDEVELVDPAPVSRAMPSSEQLEKAASAIVQSRLPLIVAGGGVALSGAEQALLELVEASNIPVVTSGGGKGAIPDSHPLCYGSCVSPGGERHEMNQLLDVMKSADLVVGIGTAFLWAILRGGVHAGEHQHRRVRSQPDSGQHIALHGDPKRPSSFVAGLVEAGGVAGPSSFQAGLAAAAVWRFAPARNR